MKRLGLLVPLAACHPPPGETGAELTRPRLEWSAVSATAAGGAAVSGAAAAGAAAPAGRPLARVVSRTGAPVVLARDGAATIAFVADEDGSAIRVIDVDRQDEISALALPGRPVQLAMLEDGRLVATLRDRGELAVLAGTGLPDAPLAIAQRIALAAEPIGLALVPSDRELLVTSGWGHTLTVLDVPAEQGRPLAVARSWELAAEPRGVVTSDDGKFAFVSHAVGQSLERIELAGGATTSIRVAGSEVLGTEGPDVDISRQACQGFALAKSIAPAGRIFAPQVLAFTGAADQPSAGYGSPDELTPEVFDVAVIDEDRGKALAESLKLRILHRGGACVLPRAAAASARGALYVACLGEDALVELDGASIAPVNAELRRWPVPRGPAGIAIDDAHDRAIVWSQYAHTLTTIPTGPGARPMVQALALGEGLPAQLARGRELFAAVGDRRISKTGQACESCHPDGRQDALVWSSPNGPRQTPMLAGRLADTAPYGWNGDAKDLATHVKSTMKRLQGTGLAGEDLDALLAYVTSMGTPVAAAAAAAAVAPAAGATGAVASTAGAAGAATLVAEGEAIFRSADAQCASCHGEDGRTPDGMRHNVGSRAAGDQRRELDTPSLAFLSGSAPYYHDGRFATLRELLEKSRGKMGQVRPFSPHELDALEAYLRTR